MKKKGKTPYYLIISIFVHFLILYSIEIPSSHEDAPRKSTTLKHLIQKEKIKEMQMKKPTPPKQARPKLPQTASQKPLHSQPPEKPKEEIIIKNQEDIKEDANQGDANQEDTKKETIIDFSSDSILDYLNNNNKTEQLKPLSEQERTIEEILGGSTKEAYLNKLNLYHSSLWGGIRYLDEPFECFTGEIFEFKFFIKYDGSLIRVVHLTARQNAHKDYGPVERLIYRFTKEIFPTFPFPASMTDSYIIQSYTIRCLNNQWSW